ncbi:MAG: hypothetical protein HY319_01255 [Armatimonadetes bacterium]|nr:hypothetical protein [Armatimonadota bacterium]
MARPSPEELRTRAESLEESCRQRGERIEQLERKRLSAKMKYVGTRSPTSEIES